MKRGTSIFLKGCLVLFGLIVLALCIFALPRIAESAAEAKPNLAYLQYPVLIGIYVTAIPFYLALYQSYALLQLIEQRTAFSQQAIQRLKQIQHDALAIMILYGIGMIGLFSLGALHPGVALLGLTILFSSLVIAVFATVLQELLRRAEEIKSENDLTV